MGMESIDICTLEKSNLLEIMNQTATASALLLLLIPLIAANQFNYIRQIFQSTIMYMHIVIIFMHKISKQSVPMPSA
jgi:hypothetical protein